MHYLVNIATLDPQEFYDEEYFIQSVQSLSQLAALVQLSAQAEAAIIEEDEFLREEIINSGKFICDLTKAGPSPEEFESTVKFNIMSRKAFNNGLCMN